MSSRFFKHSASTFVHAINSICYELTVTVEDLLELGGHGTLAYAWLDGLTHINPDDITLPESLIESFIADKVDITTNIVLQREAKSLRTLQQSFMRSKLFIGADETPYPPMLRLMDSTLTISLS